MSTIRKFVLAAIAVASVSTAHATVLTQGGYADTEIAVMNSGYSNFYGNIVVDTQGNRYVTGSFSRSVYKISPSGTVSSFVSLGGNGTVIGLEIVGSNLYVGNGSSIVSVPLSGGQATAVTSVSGEAMGLAHSLDGQNLFISTNTGIFKYNFATKSTTSLLGNGYYSAIATGLDGTIYATDYMNGKILAYNSSANTFSNFRVGLSGVAGLAIDPVSGDVFAAVENSGNIERISADGSKAMTFATNVSWDGGYYPSSMEFDPRGGSLYYTQSGANYSSFTLHQISGFPEVVSKDVPEPASLALLGLGIVAGAVARRRKA